MLNRLMADSVVALPNACPVTLPPKACCCRYQNREARWMAVRVSGRVIFCHSEI